jgi:dTDP-4-amino-4,6-dideoxygalactose transaminase
MTSDSGAPIPFLDLRAQHRPLKSELLAIFSEALDQAAFIGGAQVQRFEEEFAAYTGVPHAIGMSNGTDAIRVALQAMGIGRGDPVVTVPNTFIATTEAISHSGADFEFVDADPETCLMDPNRLEAHLKRRFSGPPGSSRPKAILPVHLYGQLADMNAIMGLARQYELKVLEDAAQAHGATQHGKSAGQFGDAATFSFYPGKNLGACGDAGAIVTRDAGIAERSRMLRDHGQKAKYLHELEGTNARLDAVQAGMLRVKLKRLPEWNARRREVAAQYDAAFAELKWVRPVKILNGNVSCYHLYVVHVPERDKLQAALQAQQIATGLHYPVPLHLQACYSHLNLPKGSFPATEQSAATLISLPMFPELTGEQIRRVVGAIAAFGERL